jgi:nucleoside 2-deoxyribosyltransferase
MLIYFTASIVGKKHYYTDYLKIVDYLQDKGHRVISEHILKSSPEKIHMENKEERLKFHEQLEKWINSCDCIVAETSFPSISVGYEISLALSRGKPVLILYQKGSSPPSLLVHHKDEKLICEKYSSEMLTDIIDDFLSYARDTEDSRFIFYITSEIASFLDKASKKEKVPKSVYLRRLIEEKMREH